MEFNLPDTLVLKIVERDVDLNRPDTTLYILYDKKEHKYIIRGKRFETKRMESCSYAFDCEFAHDLADFIEFLIDREHTISYILYNYDNLPKTSNEIDYDFLYRYDDIVYELSGYDKLKLNRKELLKNLRMLRNIYNNY
jgi:hypothetical protein